MPDFGIKNSAIAALALIVLVLAARIYGVPVIGGGLKSDLAHCEEQRQAEYEARMIAEFNTETLTLKIKEQNEQIADLAEASAYSDDRRAEAVRDANRANARGDIDANRIRTRDRSNDDDCETPDEIREADL